LKLRVNNGCDQNIATAHTRPVLNKRIKKEGKIMNRIVFLTCIGSLALALTAF
jgi:hypothetical protein